MAAVQEERVRYAGRTRGDVSCGEGYYAYGGRWEIRCARGPASGEYCLLRWGSFHIPLLLQPGDQEICGGFRHFRADTLDVLLGHFMNGLRFHLVKFTHSVPFRVHNNYLVPKSLLTQQNTGQRNSYADNFTGRIAVLVGKGQHVFDQVGVEIDLHFGSTVFYERFEKTWACAFVLLEPLTSVRQMQLPGRATLINSASTRQIRGQLHYQRTKVPLQE